MRAYPSNATSCEDYRPALPSPLPLPKELGELANLTYFNAAENKLQGWLSTRSERFRFRVDIIKKRYAGQLPKELGKLVNLKVFNVFRSKIEGQLSIRTEQLRTTERFKFLVG